MTEAEQLKLDNDRLRQLVQYCRMRLKHDAYREQVDKCLSDLSLLDPDPEMQGKLIQSHERSWTGPGHLEDTGYVDKQERCPTCERTDRQYKLGRERGHHGLCRDPWHDHLRSSTLTSQQGNCK